MCEELKLGPIVPLGRPYMDVWFEESYTESLEQRSLLREREGHYHHHHQHHQQVSNLRGGLGTGEAEDQCLRTTGCSIAATCDEIKGSAANVRPTGSLKASNNF